MNLDGKEREVLELEVAEKMYGGDDWYRRDRWPEGMLQNHMESARVAIRAVSAALAAREEPQPSIDEREQHQYELGFNRAMASARVAAEATREAVAPRLAAREDTDDRVWGNVPYEYQRAMKALHESWGAVDPEQPWPQFLRQFCTEVMRDTKRPDDAREEMLDRLERGGDIDD
jgi:hypothetical protein